MVKNQGPGTKIYDLEYYTGAQAFLYIGDVWVDETTSFMYTCQQSKTPIYGYASQLFDDVAKGQVIVQGAFTVNYKEQGYLWAVLRRYKNIEMYQAMAGQEGNGTGGSYNSFDKGLGIGTSTDRRPVWGSNATRINRAGIERLMEISKGSVPKGDEYEFYKDLSGYATVDGTKIQDKIFEDMVEVFEDQIWNASIGNAKLNEQYRRPDHNAFDNFDMYLVFGNYANPGANHTVVKLMNVYLTSSGKTIKIDGEPIAEAYTFLARTIA